MERKMGKKKKLLSILLAACMVLSMLPTSAFAETGGYPQHGGPVAGEMTAQDQLSGAKENEGLARQSGATEERWFGFEPATGTIKSYGKEAGAPTDVVIPARIGGVPVSIIGDDAFKETNITSVVVPIGVEVIRPNAFLRCTSLQRIELPESLSVIGVSAFEGCTALVSAKLPQSLTVLEGNAFLGCTGIQEFVVPRNLTALKGSAVPPAPRILFESDSKLKLSDYNAFRDNNRLTSIAFPASLETLEQSFYNCSANTVFLNSKVKVNPAAFDRTWVFNIYINQDEASFPNSEQAPWGPTGVSPHWKDSFYTVTYNANGGTGAVEDLTPYSPGGGAATILAGTDLARRGYTFAGWNTSADGTGTGYAPGSTVALDQYLTLYAQWDVDPAVSYHSVTYEPNFTENAPSPVVTGDFVAGSALRAEANSFHRDGYGFSGWNTDAGGSGDRYRPGDWIALDQNLTLYAQWTKSTAPRTNPVHYFGNGGTGAMNDPDSYNLGDTATVLDNLFYYNQHHFTGWNTAPDGSGTAYAPKSTFEVTGTTALYAQWSEGEAFTVSYDANGGTGDPPAPETYLYDDAMQENEITVKENPFAKGNAVFTGWNTRADGSGAGFQPGDAAWIYYNMKLYAQWDDQNPYYAPSITRRDSGGDLLQPVLSSRAVQIGDTYDIVYDGLSFYQSTEASGYTAMYYTEKGRINTNTFCRNSPMEKIIVGGALLLDQNKQPIDTVVRITGFNGTPVLKEVIYKAGEAREPTVMTREEILALTGGVMPDCIQVKYYPVGGLPGPTNPYPPVGYGLIADPVKTFLQFIEYGGTETDVTWDSKDYYSRPLLRMSDWGGVNNLNNIGQFVQSFCGFSITDFSVEPVGGIAISELNPGDEIDFVGTFTNTSNVYKSALTRGYLASDALEYVGGSAVGNGGQTVTLHSPAAGTEINYPEGTILFQMSDPDKLMQPGESRSFRMKMRVKDDYSPDAGLNVRALTEWNGFVGTGIAGPVFYMAAAAPNPITLADATYTVGDAAAPLHGNATSGDGGTISYEWYSNTSASTTGGTRIDGATEATYTPSTATPGTFYYYVVATNTVANQGGGAMTASATSNVSTISVNSSGGGGSSSSSSGRLTVRYDIDSRLGSTRDRTSEQLSSGARPRKVPVVTVKDAEKNVFVGWTLDPRAEQTKLDDPRETVITQNTTFYAVFAQIEEHKHYMNGYDSGIFAPEDNITRAQLATIIARACLDDFHESNNYGNGGYRDVSSDYWAAGAIACCTDKGVFTGVGEGLFEPERSITRQEFALVFARMAGLMTTGDMPFTDAGTIADWAMPGVYVAYTRGWLDGYADGTFKPRNNITRSEAVKIVNRYLDRGVDMNGIASVSGDLKQWPDVPESHWAYYEIMEASSDHTFYYTNGTNPPEVYTRAYIEQASPSK